LKAKLAAGKGEAYVPLDDPEEERKRQLKAQMETDGADDLFSGFTVKTGEAATGSSPKKDSKAKAGAKKKAANNIVYDDEFESFHLSTQEKCEELCSIVIEKLEEAGKKGHMRGCESRFAIALAKVMGPNLTMKDLDDLQKKLAAAKKQKKVEAAEKANRAGCNEAKHAKMVTNVNSAQAHLDERYAYDDDDSDEDGGVVGDYDENGDYVEGYYKGSQWIETKRYKAGTFDAADFA